MDMEIRDTAGVEKITGPSGMKFECTGCGKCCKGPGNVYIARKEMDAIVSFLKIKPKEKNAFIKRIVQYKKGDFLVHSSGGACRFLDENDRCSIYEVRPLQCRTYPFWPSYFQDAKSYRSLKKECEGVEREAKKSYSPLAIARRLSRTAKDFFAFQEQAPKKFMI